jgi:hypothetical protein
MQDAAFILNIFSFLPKKMKPYRNVSLIVNLIKSAVFTYFELDFYYSYDASSSDFKHFDGMINYVIYSVEGILIQPLLIAGYVFVYRKQA